MPIEVLVKDDWFCVPHAVDIDWISTRQALPFFKLEVWQNYMITVRDLCEAGF